MGDYNLPQFQWAVPQESTSRPDLVAIGKGTEEGRKATSSWFSTSDEKFRIWGRKEVANFNQRQVSEHFTGGKEETTLWGFSLQSIFKKHPDFLLFLIPQRCLLGETFIELPKSGTTEKLLALLLLLREKSPAVKQVVQKLSETSADRALVEKIQIDKNPDGEVMTHLSNQERTALRQLLQIEELSEQIDPKLWDLFLEKMAPQPSLDAMSNEIVKIFTAYKLLGAELNPETFPADFRSLAEEVDTWEFQDDGQFGGKLQEKFARKNAPQPVVKRAPVVDLPTTLPSLLRLLGASPRTLTWMRKITGGTQPKEAAVEKILDDNEITGLQRREFAKELLMGMPEAAAEEIIDYCKSIAPERIQAQKYVEAVGGKNRDILERVADLVATPGSKLLGGIPDQEEVKALSQLAETASQWAKKYNISREEVADVAAMVLKMDRGAETFADVFLGLKPQYIRLWVEKTKNPTYLEDVEKIVAKFDPRGTTPALMDQAVKVKRDNPGLTYADVAAALAKIKKGERGDLRELCFQAMLENQFEAKYSSFIKKDPTLKRENSPTLLAGLKERIGPVSGTVTQELASYYNELLSLVVQGYLRRETSESDLLRHLEPLPLKPKAVGKRSRLSEETILHLSQGGGTTVSMGGIQQNVRERPVWVLQQLIPPVVGALEGGKNPRVEKALEENFDTIGNAFASSEAIQSLLGPALEQARNTSALSFLGGIDLPAPPRIDVSNLVKVYREEAIEMQTFFAEGGKITFPTDRVPTFSEIEFEGKNPPQGTTIPLLMRGAVFGILNSRNTDDEIDARAMRVVGQGIQFLGNKGGGLIPERMIQSLLASSYFQDILRHGIGLSLNGMIYGFKKSIQPTPFDPQKAADLLSQGEFDKELKELGLSKDELVEEYRALAPPRKGPTDRLQQLVGAMQKIDITDKKYRELLENEVKTAAAALHREEVKKKEEVPTLTRLSILQELHKKSKNGDPDKIAGEIETNLQARREALDLLNQAKEPVIRIVLAILPSVLERHKIGPKLSDMTALIGGAIDTSRPLDGTEAAKHLTSLVLDILTEVEQAEVYQDGIDAAMNALPVISRTEQ